MGSLARNRMTEMIICVLRDFSKYFRKNEKRFSGYYILSDLVSNSRGIINNNTLMTNMLWRLSDEALVQMYRECGALTEKFDLNTKSMMAGYKTAEIDKKATFDGDVGYIDIKHLNLFSLSMGWNDEAVQKGCGYADVFDEIANKMIFNIHATKFELYDDKVLRLWKGCYMGAVGGEIGVYGTSEKITNLEMKNKVNETIKEFLTLTGQTLKEDLTKLSLEEIKNKLVKIALLDREIRRINRKPISEQVLNILRNLLLTTTVVMFIPQEIMLLVSANIIVRIVLLKRMIVFIVEMIKIIREMGKDDDVFSEEWGPSLSKEEIENDLGIEGTAIQVYGKKKNDLIVERREYDSGFWATAFKLFDARGGAEYFLTKGNVKDQIYTVNHFYFKDEKSAARFFDSVKNGNTIEYPANEKEEITIPERHSKSVVIVYGK